jgi:hypothetical protein
LIKRELARQEKKLLSYAKDGRNTFAVSRESRATQYLGEALRRDESA